MRGDATLGDALQSKAMVLSGTVRVKRYDLSVSNDRSCEHCGAERTILIGMEPGKDGMPWWLCVRCWADGLHPGKLGRIPSQYLGDTPATAAPKRRKTG